MSFFPQTQRKQIFSTQKIKTPSPFQYNTHGLSKPTCGVAPFGSTTKLNRSVSSRFFNDKFKQQNMSVHQRLDNSVLDNLTYQIIKKQNKTSAFKSQTQRFVLKTQILPGPAQYDIKLLEKVSYKKIIMKNKSESTHNFFTNAQKIKVPSIPSDHLGYKQDKNNKMQKVIQSINYQPHPGAYQLRTQLIKKNGLQWRNTKVKKDKYNQPTPGPGEYEVKSQKQDRVAVASFISTNQRFNSDSNKKQKRPGPGSYNPQYPIKKQEPQMIHQSHFNSKTSRFSWMNPSTNIGPGQYLNRDKQKSKSMIHFKKTMNDKNSTFQKYQQSKNTVFNQNNLNPGPGQYANTLGMGFQLQKSLLRKYADSILPKGKRTLFQIKKQEVIPGPGSYNLNQNQKALLKKKDKGLYKKCEIINLKEEGDEIGPSPIDYANFNNTIEQKLNQSKNKLTLTQNKPFGAGQHRFKHYQANNNQDEQYIQKMRQGQNQFSSKKVKKIVMTNVKVNIPFGSSSHKITNKVQQHIVFEFYVPKQDWIKKSHNIKSKLNEYKI